MSRLLPDEQVVDAYRRTSASVLELVARTPESSATLTVSACPDWTVQQTLSHLVGVPEDLLADRREGITSDAWTHAQVQRHAGETLAELMTTYRAVLQRFDSMLPAIPSPSNSQLVMDAVTHELDIREALGVECPDSSLSMNVANAWLLDMIERRDASLLDPLTRTSCSEFDLLRSLTGRNSATRMASLGLPGDRIVAALAGTPLKPPS